MPTSPVVKATLAIASGGGLGWVRGEGREDAGGGGGGGGREDGACWAGIVAAALGVVDAGLAAAVDAVAAVDGVTSATGLGPRWLANRPQPVTTMITPTRTATEVLALSTPS